MVDQNGSKVCRWIDSFSIRPARMENAHVFHEYRNFFRSTTGRFGRCTSKMKITGNTETKELFALIKKVCVNGIQKP